MGTATNLMTEKNYRILVLDADQRSALAIVRSLGKDSSLMIYTASPDTNSVIFFGH